MADRPGGERRKTTRDRRTANRLPRLPDLSRYVTREVYNTLLAIVEDNRHQLTTQFERIAQMQVNLDRLNAKTGLQIQHPPRFRP